MAYVLSSISGNLISAASAGFAPTNGADVSAIASAYQVVSATSTQLYAGSSYLTGVNEAPISAERAGNAANASLATSAWYDGTGRFISALPDSAAVSAIASAYAESAASSKQDTLAFAYNTADQISSINGSALGGMDEGAVSSIASAYAEAAASGKLDTTAFNSADFYTTANESGYVGSAYVDSAISGKLDTTAFSDVSGTFLTSVDLSPYQTTADMSGYIPTSMSSDFQQVTGMSSYVPYSSIGYNTASAISGINGSALAGTTYSAGTGIDITDDVISVETPVDIVAGPGIVIDNPDGNTLRVSTDANYETVLWSGDYSLSATGTLSLSESWKNFEYVKVFGYWNELDLRLFPLNGECYTNPFTAKTGVEIPATTPGFVTWNSASAYWVNVTVPCIFSSNTGVRVESSRLVGKWNNTWQCVNAVNGFAHLVKVVGIHRTASN